MKGETMMTISDRAQLLDLADGRIRDAGHTPRRLVLLSSGISFALALLIALLNYLLAWQVNANAGGLAGLPLRTVLETVSTALRYALSLAMPFWSIGFVSAMLLVARGQEAAPKSLLEGFRRFGPVLRLELLEGLIYTAVAMVCMYAAALLFMLTPFASDALALLEPVMEAATVEQMETYMAQLSYEQMLSALLPAFVIFALVYLAVALPLLYRLRMAQFAIMDRPGTGAREALRISSRIMRGNRWQLLRLDLHFWWYYALSLVTAALAYADELPALLGFELPISDTAAFFGAYALYVLTTLALHLWMLHRVRTVYAVVYDVLLHRGFDALPDPGSDMTENRGMTDV